MNCFATFMAGWWYGVVGHLESCNGNENHCRCHISGELINVNFLLDICYYQSLLFLGYYGIIIKLLLDK